MVTDDKAESINALIKAVEAIEIELGLTPSGAYSDVRTRLDILESRINNPLVPSPFIITNIKTSNYTTNYGELVRCDPSGGGFIITLPTAASHSGKQIIVKNITSSSNGITINTTSLETIDGSLSKIINSSHQSLILISDNSNWELI